MPHRPELIVGSYNIHKAVGTDRRLDPHRVISVIREMAPDLIALQEVDKRFGDRRGILDLDELYAQTGLQPVRLSLRKSELAHGWHGNLILFKNAELEDVRTIDLPGMEPRGAIVADLSFAGQPIRIIAAHLGLLKGSRLLQARRLADEISPDRPTLMMGDLNEWRRGPGCSLMPLKTGLDAVARASTVASFPSARPMLALDRIIGCTRAEVVDLSPHTSALSRMASDHLPIRARIRLGT
ncbi:endonuclease/exonuclease/phosphatase family protein [Pararhodobacter zhoushanensis]|uniref:endonuclease/exonuclease/phosphatase family protein n=1 Tax=Pararhodobacter zhoushanensis TaxID=2479545 RepID=UPI000F8F3BD4|nr:endonuclease/exonuclease/phosphatase family protein [Pararhodobacter zhoushanensis]